MLARDCRRCGDDAAKDVTQALNRRIAAYWVAEMADHFADEERLLVELARALDASMRARVLEDHRVLRAACTAAAADALDAAALRGFGERLAAHVRFEERTCFPRLQAASESAPDPDAHDIAR